MKGIVIDCSVAMAWFLRDHPEPYAEKVLLSLDSTVAVVPGLWLLEVVNVFVQAERRGRVAREQSLQALSHLRSLPIQIESVEESSAPETILKLAGDFQLTAYDAAYLDTALRRCFPMATLDEALRKACRNSEVPVFEP